MFKLMRKMGWESDQHTSSEGGVVQTAIPSSCPLKIFPGLYVEHFFPQNYSKNIFYSKIPLFLQNIPCH